MAGKFVCTLSNPTGGRMPHHHQIPFDLDEGSWTFLRKSDGFSAEAIHRANQRNSEDRQRQFESELRRLALFLDVPRIPVFLATPTKGNVRLDLGCIGHAIANDILEFPANELSGYVEWVTLR
jgi:hypothetical protein